MKTKNKFLMLLCAATLSLALSPKAKAQSSATRTFVVHLSDTANISEIQVKLGTQQGSDDLALKTFGYNETEGTVAEGCAYVRTGNSVKLNISYSSGQKIYGEVRTKSAMGGWSNARKFSFR